MHSFKKMLQSLYFHNYPFHGEMSNTITAGTSDHLLIFSLVYVDINWQILEITGLRGPWRGWGGLQGEEGGGDKKTKRGSMRGEGR